MADSRLIVCTGCDSAVISGVGHNGYHGQCECETFYFELVSGDRPETWETWGEVTDPIDFEVYREGHDYIEGVAVEEDHVACTRCNDDGDVEILVEDVDLLDVDLKVTFRCLADHFQNDREIESIAYYNSSNDDGKSLLKMADSEWQ